MSSFRETAGERARRLALEAECSAIGRELARRMPEGVGFTLMMANFGEHGGMAYLSNIDRADMMRMVREWLARLEGGPS